MANPETTKINDEKVLTLEGLRDRLNQIIEQNNLTRRPDYNKAPVFLTMKQGETPTGRRRPNLHIPVCFASSSQYGIYVGEKIVYTIELIGGETLDSSGKKTNVRTEK